MVKDLFTTFKGYVDNLSDIIKNKLPEIIREAERLPEEAEEAKEHCKHEFEGLDMMAKGKAMMGLAKNIAKLSKVPTMIKGVFETLKSELQEIKEAVQDLKSDMQILGSAAIKCVKNQKKTPNECYVDSFGEIKYTTQERADWEKKMQSKCRSNGTIWDPNAYPKTNMLPEGVSK
jgi:hypothetical protein